MTKPKADLTVAKAAAELDIHPETLRILLKSGEITGYKVGSDPQRARWRITRAALNAFKDRGGYQPAPVGRPKKDSE